MFEFFFKYPRTAFEESSLILASDWPVIAAFILFALATAALVFTLFLRRTSLKFWQLGSIGLLQTMMVALVLLVLWQPALMSERLVPGENAVAILLDTSSSMAFVENEQSGEAQTRMQQALSLLTEEGLEDISETYTVLPYSLSDQAERLENFSELNLPAPKEATDLGQSVIEALRQSTSSSVGAVIVISDGADNDGAISQAELNEISAYGVPVHTVGLGREIVPEDLELTDVVLPAKALPGTTLSARVTIRHDQPGIARLKVYDGDTFLSTQEISLNPNDNTTLAYVDINAEDPGQLDLRFTLDPIAGERNQQNNTRGSVVDIQENRYKLLYVEGEPRWEYKFMQRALADDPSIQLTTLLRVSTNKFYRQGIEDPTQLADGFPMERAELFDYDALIIGSVAVAEFTEEQQTMIRDFVSERGGSLMMIAGLNGLGLGGWGDSVVNEILPSRLSTTEASFIRNQAPVSLTQSGENSPILTFSDSESDNNQQWRDLPAIADYQFIGPLRPAATTLLEFEASGRKHPLLVSQPYGKGQSVILATGGTWRWQMSLPVEDKRHETFWRQLARGLVANSPRPFELSSTVEGENIIVRAELRDPNAEENQGLEVSAVISSDTNEVINVELLPVPGSAGLYEASFQPSAPGLFSIEAISRVGDNPISSTRTATRFDQSNEAFNTRQNRALLERLALATGGQYWTKEQWDEIDDAIAYSDAGITEQDISLLWDAPIFFFLLFVLKAAEWALRRSWRTI